MSFIFLSWNYYLNKICNFEKISLSWSFAVVACDVTSSFTRLFMAVMEEGEFLTELLFYYLKVAVDGKMFYYLLANIFVRCSVNFLYIVQQRMEWFCRVLDRTVAANVWTSWLLSPRFLYVSFVTCRWSNVDWVYFVLLSCLIPLCADILILICLFYWNFLFVFEVLYILFSQYARGCGL